MDTELVILDLSQDQRGVIRLNWNQPRLSISLSCLYDSARITVQRHRGALIHQHKHIHYTSSSRRRHGV